jgi:hypothetical protein
VNEERGKNVKKNFDPGKFPALREFLPGYLHQDFGAEYGSAVEAVKGFLADAREEQIRNVSEERHLFREFFEKREFAEVQAALVRLGSAGSLSVKTN